MRDSTAPSPRSIVVYFLLLLIAAALQAVLSHQLRWHGGQPDFVMAVTLAAALLADTSIGSLVGFGGGLLIGGVVGETVGTFIVSRTVAGFVTGWFSGRMFRGNLFVALIAVLCGSLTSEIIYLLAAPRIGILRWLSAAAIGTVWNLVLALPLTWLLRKAGWGTQS